MIEAETLRSLEPLSPESKMQEVRHQSAGTACSHCGIALELGAKFCGECGSANPVDKRASAPVKAPAFAQVQPSMSSAFRQEMEAEQARLMIQLIRERALLLLHWTMLVGLNLIGFWLALKCYLEFHADEMSRIMIASTPCLFINSLALLFIVNIRGTRQEITRLKERINFVRFKIEFEHLK